jgi:glc operon protein GlcG
VESFSTTRSRFADAGSAGVLARIGEAQPAQQKQNRSHRKGKPFRTSSGKAAVVRTNVMKSSRIIFAICTLAIVAVAAKAQLPTKQVLTLDAAKRIAAASEAEAKRRGATVVIAVVDDGGYLLVLERLDDTQVASVDVGIAKARTAAIFRRPSKVFEDQVKNGRVSALALPGAVALQGGVPIIIDGKVVGAVGVSGNSPQEDEDIAKVGADYAAAAIKGEKQ